MAPSKLLITEPDKTNLTLVIRPPILDSSKTDRVAIIAPAKAPNPTPN